MEEERERIEELLTLDVKENIEEVKDIQLNIGYVKDSQL